MATTPTYRIAGTRVQTLDDFWVAIGEAVNGPGGSFASTLDALDDALWGGMGQPDDGRCTFVWEDAELSRLALGFDETVRQLERGLERCHPVNRDNVREDPRRAQAEVGPTAFDWLLDCFNGSRATLLLR